MCENSHMGETDSAADPPDISTPEEAPPKPSESSTKLGVTSWNPRIQEAPTVDVYARIRRVLSDPPWWIRDGLVAFVVASVVSGVTLAYQSRLDDRRAEHAQALADEQNRQAQRLENLRFVRDHSSTDPGETRHFAGFDLQDQDMSGLQLRGADFERADLREADLSLADLSSLIGEGGRAASVSDANLTEAWLYGANLRGLTARQTIFVDAQLGDADLTDAYLPWSDFTDADLTSATLEGADFTFAEHLDRADLTFATYDDETRWPYGFQPPEDARKVEVKGR